MLALAASGTGCGAREPFDYVKVSGTVTYEDGSLIPGERVVVMFLPQMKALNPTTYPRPGIAEVDVRTGRFECVTSHKYCDGVVPGEHKILVEAMTSVHKPLLGPPAVPAEYRAADRTPLLVDSRDSPFHLLIRKP
jgi:hypothetical protein